MSVGLDLSSRRSSPQPPESGAESECELLIRTSCPLDPEHLADADGVILVRAV